VSDIRCVDTFVGNLTRVLQQVNWDYVRVLSDGEAVSTAGTHLGHNLPDGKGNRYCINLVSVAGKPE